MKKKIIELFESPDTDVQLIGVELLKSAEMPISEKISIIQKYGKSILYSPFEEESVNYPTGIYLDDGITLYHPERQIDSQFTYLGKFE